MKHYIIESPDKSEKCIVFDPAEYEEWTVLGESDRAPGEDEEWEPKTKKWVKNIEACAKREKEKKCRDIPALLDRVDTLEATVARLEALLEGTTP